MQAIEIWLPDARNKPAPLSLPIRDLTFYNRTPTPYTLLIERAASPPAEDTVLGAIHSILHSCGWRPRRGRARVMPPAEPALLAPLMPQYALYHLLAIDSRVLGAALAPCAPTFCLETLMRDFCRQYGTLSDATFPDMARETSEMVVRPPRLVGKRDACSRGEQDFGPILFLSNSEIAGQAEEGEEEEEEPVVEDMDEAEQPRRAAPQPRAKSGRAIPVFLLPLLFSALPACYQRWNNTLGACEFLESRLVASYPLANYPAYLRRQVANCALNRRWMAFTYQHAHSFALAPLHCDDVARRLYEEDAREMVRAMARADAEGRAERATLRSALKRLAGRVDRDDDDSPRPRKRKKRD
jgi:hypothetical protein